MEVIRTSSLNFQWSCKTLLIAKTICYVSRIYEYITEICDFKPYL